MRDKRATALKTKEKAETLMQACIREVHDRQRDFEKSQKVFLKASTRVDLIDKCLKEKLGSQFAPEADVESKPNKPYPEIHWDGDDDSSSNSSW